MLLCVPGRSIELIPCKHSSGAFCQTIEHGIFAMIQVNFFSGFQYPTIGRIDFDIPK